MSGSSLTKLLSRNDSMNSSGWSILRFNSDAKEANAKEVDPYGNLPSSEGGDKGSRLFHELNPNMWISQILKIDNSVWKFLAALVYAIFAFPVFLIDLSSNMEGAKPVSMGLTDKGWNSQEVQ